VKIVGEDPSLGRPYLYGTTRLFLETYGLRRLDDLPHAEELRRAPGAGTPGDAEAEEEPAASGEPQSAAALHGTA
jgi:segregation and condensation protein B